MKDHFTFLRESTLRCIEGANKRKDQMSVVELEGDLEMINHILKIITITYMDQCKVCAKMRRYPQSVLDSWKKDSIIHNVYHVPSWWA